MTKIKEIKKVIYKKKKGKPEHYCENCECYRYTPCKCKKKGD